MGFNKSIIFLPAHRYNLGRCNAADWTELNRKLIKLNEIEYNTVAAMSRYDVEYLKYYTGIKAPLISSFSGFYTQDNLYKPTRKEILLFSKPYNNLDKLSGSSVIKNAEVELVHKLYPHYQLSDLVKHRGIICIPYSVMSYTLTELYSLAIPLFMPSPKYMLSNGGVGNDRATVSRPYCKNEDLDATMPQHQNSSHPYSPNINMHHDPEAEMYWLQFSDFYDWPHIQLFDSLEDLDQKLGSVNFTSIHLKMQSELELRKSQVLQSWCHVVQKVEMGRKIPQFYTHF